MEISKLRQETTIEKQRVADAQKEVQRLFDEDDEDVDLKVTLQETKAEKGVHDRLWATCTVTAEQAERIQLNQRIGNVKLGDNSQYDVGVPENVVDKVRSQTIGDVTVGSGSKGSVGVHKAS